MRADGERLTTDDRRPTTDDRRPTTDDRRPKSSHARIGPVKPHLSSVVHRRSSAAKPPAPVRR
jgi:hypothetical protein